MKASKRDRRFAACSPAHSFVAIADGARHVYVYRSTVAVDDSCELRNRRSGRRVRTFAQQHVLTLPSTIAQRPPDGDASALPTLTASTASVGDQLSAESEGSQTDAILGFRCDQQFLYVLTLAFIHAIHIN